MTQMDWETLNNNGSEVHLHVNVHSKKVWRMEGEREKIETSTIEVRVLTHEFYNILEILGDGAGVGTFKYSTILFLPL